MKILDVLQVRPTSAVLPCETQCPLCSGSKLRIYHDYNSHGVWIYCRDCRFAGDIIELAMAAWKGLDIRTTIKKIEAMGIDIPPERLVPVNVDIYVLVHPDRRKRMWTLWEKSQKRLLVDDSKIHRFLQHKLGIRLNLDRDRWLQGPGLFVGGTDKGTVESTFMPNVHANPTRLGNAGSDRVFVGAGWTDVLALPFSDFPGRIKGFLFYGREGRIPTDTRYKLIRYSGEGVIDKRSWYWRSSENDCGIAMYEAAWHAKDTLFVMSDPFLALRMQSWHLQDNSIPAPVVSMYADTQVRTNPMIWGNFKQQLIFWGKPDAEMFRHAKAVNGLVSMTGFGIDGPIKTFTKTPLSEWLGRAKEDAQPWEEALETVLNKLPTATSEAILLGMELSPSELVKFLRTCPDDLQERLEPCIQRTVTRTILLNDTAIREDNGWYIDKTSELISSAVLRIEEVVYHPRLDQIYYTGRVLIAGRNVPFCERSTTVESNTFRWMRHLLLRANAGYMEYAPKWEPLAVTIATRFHPPTSCQGLDSVGWNEDRTCFVFPDYLIDKKGEVVEDPAIKVNRRRTPGLMLRRPEELTGDDIAALSQQPAAGIFWATATSVIANIVAPIYNATPSPIGIVSDDEDAGKNFVKALGCAEFTVREQLRQQSEESLTDVCNEHGWPIYLRPTPRVTVDDWLDWLTSPESKNCVVPLNWYSARAMTTRRGWYVIEAGDFLAHPGTSDAASKVLPSFLQYLARARFRIELPRLSLFKRINAALADWFAACGGDPAVVTSALKVMLSEDQSKNKQEPIVDSLADLLCRLYDDGELALERAGFIPTGKALKALIAFPGKNGTDGDIFIPKALVNRLLLAHSAPMLDSGVISKALVDTRRGFEQEYGGLPGWMLNETYWNKRLARWRAKYKTVLRLVT
jgi:hypothetical protein